MSNKKLVIISVIILIPILLFLGIKPFLESATKGMENNEIGKIHLPNNYIVIKISAKNREITHNGGGPTIVDSDITEVGWNSRYVIYQRVALGNVLECGLLDTLDGSVKAIDPSLLKEQCSELNIALKKVENLFPETRGNS